MNAEQLNAIKERAAKATPGPWKNEFVGLSRPSYSVINAELDYTAHIYEEADAEFIATAREDVPALVTEVERLRAELEDIIAVATEEAVCLSYESGYEDIETIARKALGINP